MSDPTFAALRGYMHSVGMPDDQLRDALNVFDNIWLAIGECHRLACLDGGSSFDYQSPPPFAWFVWQLAQFQHMMESGANDPKCPRCGGDLSAKDLPEIRRLVATGLTPPLCLPCVATGS